MNEKTVILLLLIASFSLGYFIADMINQKKQSRETAMGTLIIGNIFKSFSKELHSLIEKKDYSNIEECAKNMECFSQLNLGLWEASRDKFSSAEKEKIEKDVHYIPPK